MNKSFHGLKQAARAWNQALHSALIESGGEQSENDKCLYKIRDGKTILIVLIHVDDLLIAGNSNSLLKKVTDYINTRFELKDFGTCLPLSGHRCEAT